MLSHILDIREQALYQIARKSLQQCVVGVVHHQHDGFEAPFLVKGLRSQRDGPRRRVVHGRQEHIELALNEIKQQGTSFPVQHDLLGVKSQDTDENPHDLCVEVLLGCGVVFVDVKAELLTSFCQHFDIIHILLHSA